jgi:hypothetical protein
MTVSATIQRFITVLRLNPHRLFVVIPGLTRNPVFEFLDSRSPIEVEDKFGGNDPIRGFYDAFGLWT